MIYLYKDNIIFNFQIKIILGYVVTKRSFHAKTGCDSRIYEYLLPSSVFMGPSKRKLGKEQQNENDLKLVYGDEVYYIPRSTPEENKVKETYRINEETLAKFREAMKMYQGTHNFHNFTIGRGAADKSCNRYIMSTKVIYRHQLIYNCLYILFIMIIMKINFILIFYVKFTLG